jgi:hypothetical protein
MEFTPEYNGKRIEVKQGSRYFYDVSTTSSIDITLFLP